MFTTFAFLKITFVFHRACLVTFHTWIAFWHAVSPGLVCWLGIMRLSWCRPAQHHCLARPATEYARNYSAHTRPLAADWTEPSFPVGVDISPLINMKLHRVPTLMWNIPIIWKNIATSHTRARVAIIESERWCSLVDSVLRLFAKNETAPQKSKESKFLH